MSWTEPQKLIGRWVTCAYGRIGRIESFIETDRGAVYYGTRLAGGNFQTRVPQTIHPKDEAILNQR